MSQRIIERELGTLKRFMDDVLNIAKPRPIERFAMDVNASVAEIVESMRAEGERADVTVDGHYADGPLIDRRRPVRARPRVPQPDHQRDSGDGARRPRHGRRRRASAHQSRSRVADTGSGIPADRLSAIFDDFVTTKRRGLGLGLAIPSASSSSSTARSASRAKSAAGTSFTLRLPGDATTGRGSCGERQLTPARTETMFRTLVKTDERRRRRSDVSRCGTSSCARCAGSRRYSAEILLGPGDRIILDDDSVTNLEARATRLVPATLYSRMLAQDGVRRGRASGRQLARAAAASAARSRNGSRALSRSCREAERAYLRGRTASFSCFAIRAFTTVFAGILIASPVAGLRPIRALRF